LEFSATNTGRKEQLVRPGPVGIGARVLVSLVLFAGAYAGREHRPRVAHHQPTGSSLRSSGSPGRCSATTGVRGESDPVPPAPKNTYRLFSVRPDRSLGTRADEMTFDGRMRDRP